MLGGFSSFLKKVPKIFSHPSVTFRPILKKEKAPNLEERGLIRI